MKSQSRSILAVFAAILFIVFATSVSAQEYRGTISGTVTDPNGAFVDASHWLVIVDREALLFPGQVLRATAHNLIAGDGSSLADFVEGAFDSQPTSVLDIRVLAPAYMKPSLGRARWEVTKRGLVQLPQM